MGAVHAPNGTQVGAYMSANGDVGIRAVNWNLHSISCNFLILWPNCTSVPSLDVLELTSGSPSDVNTPLDPLRVSPQIVTTGIVSLTKKGPVANFYFKPSSFVTMTLRNHIDTFV